MTVSRALPPADVDSAPPPVFPMLPYAYMAYAEHCSRGYADHVDRLAHADEPLPAEESLGLDLIQDMNRAFFSLVWAPFGAAMDRTRS